MNNFTFTQELELNCSMMKHGAASAAASLATSITSSLAVVAALFLLVLISCLFAAFVIVKFTMNLAGLYRQVFSSNKESQ